MRSWFRGFIECFCDPWLPRQPSFCPITKATPTTQEFKVSDLINPNSREWDVDLISNLFWPVDVPCILSIPLGLDDGPDTFIWHHTSIGTYSVKSGYRVETTYQDNDFTSEDNMLQRWWKGMWNIYTPSKVRMFVWRCFNDILPTGIRLRERGVNCSVICRRCDKAFESC